MDPVTLCTSVAALLTICVQAVQIMKQTIETLQKAKILLLKLLSQTERLRIFLEQLRGFAARLGSKSGILLAFNDSAPEATMKELKVFVIGMAQSNVWIRMKVLLYKNTADKFMERLHRHEEEITQVLQFIAVSVSFSLHFRV
jgi:hypothetical protein